MHNAFEYEFLLLQVFLYVYLSFLIRVPFSEHMQAPAGSTGTWSGFGDDREMVKSISYVILLSDLKSSSLE